MFSDQCGVMEYVRNLQFIMDRYISKSYTSTKNTIARQYTERRQLLCQLLLVIISGENDTKAVDSIFFFLLRTLGYSNSEYPPLFTWERPGTLVSYEKNGKLIAALRCLADILTI